MRRKVLVSGLVAFVAVFGIVGGTNRPAWAQTGSAVALDVLNEPIPGTDRIMLVQGDPAEVYFEVEPLARTSPNDQIQLRRVDDGDLVSQEVRGEELSGTVSLSTIPENALGWLEVTYVLHPTGVVLTISEEKVLVVAEAPPEPPELVVVPSPEAPTIQAGIAAVADGGTVKIGDGVYEILQPIFVVDKNITIEGAGSSRGAGPGEDSVTLLTAPVPTEIVDAELAIGIINYIGGGGVLRDLDLFGGDACVVGRGLEGSARALAVEDVCMGNTARAVLWKAPAELSVVDTNIENCIWNGIVVAPGSFISLWGVTFSDVHMQDVKNIGYLVMDSNAYFEDLFVSGCESGGIVLYRSLFAVVDCHLLGNSIAGIAAYSSAGVITDNAIWLTTPIPTGPNEEAYGDAVAAWICPLITMSGNSVNFNSRAAVVSFGSVVEMDSNLMAGNSFDMQVEDVPAWAFGAEPSQEMKGDFKDLGGNLCGSTFPPTEPCLAQSTGLEPPEPIAPIE